MLCLACGIAAVAGAFAVLDTVLLHPIPVRDLERIVTVWDAPRAHRRRMGDLLGRPGELPGLERAPNDPRDHGRPGPLQLQPHRCRRTRAAGGGGGELGPAADLGGDSPSRPELPGIGRPPRCRAHGSPGLRSLAPPLRCRSGHRRERRAVERNRPSRRGDSARGVSTTRSRPKLGCLWVSIPPPRRRPPSTISRCSAGCAKASSSRT